MSAPAPDYQDQVELALRLRNTMVARASNPQDQVELPLRPRINMTAASALNSQDELELPLRQLPLTFAIDVSGSTLGPILRQEQDAIREICGDSMPQELVSQSSILPWCHMAFPPMRIADVEDLSSDGQTDPGALLNNPACRSTLQDASLWFLLTDGHILEPRVQKFAHAISAAGIHGKACVIILFGYPQSSPFRCNISVGMSVFAVAPHCIFLFSDVITGMIFVLQAKGSFLDILPAEKRFVPFGEGTKWADLVTIRYDDLKRVKTPRDYNGTHHVPQANSCAAHRYPMVLGSYPETDVILPLSACDACAWLLLQVRELPNGQRVDAALPLVSLATDVNRRQWVRTLNRVYERRFHEGIILYAFLSSVCFKMEDISKEKETSSTLMECLEWCCREISSLPGEPMKAGLLPPPESMPAVNCRLMTLQKLFIAAFTHSRTDNWLSNFLHYPIEGSVVLVRIASQMEAIAPHMIEIYVWKRLLYQIAEHYSALRRENGPKEAELSLKTTLGEPVLSPPGRASAAHTGLLVELFSSSYSISVAQLGDHLPSLDQFRRLGNYFAPIERTTKYHAALAVFLHIMWKVSALLQDNHPEVAYFVTYIESYGLKVQQADNPLCKVFDEPTLVGDGDVEKMIKDVYELC
ncbi:hypothetical protein CBS147343_323 [Aspergillus niger]|nr:hypothetical protein CBS133816_10199 [Aspergillus niger]KAI2839948.1 hypothetical protein CBS11350_7286 [Aspergillus niger]KAI2852545.1 hypothetical protein CBS12448_8250 [Aspergillus niger]KAI2890619.1 hypothetical protein CBS11852_6293 [Aspergillus niger]KAI2921204.1 hypothetical protein CBS147320_7767 [Aspergillus niger]